MKDLGGINCLERLMLRCRIDSVTDCWNWSMAVYSTGLPIAHVRFPWAPNVKKKTTGKRAAFELKSGKPTPKGWFVWSTCGNELCCNPDHAERGSPKAYGEAMKKYGWHKDSPAHMRANRELMKKKRKLTDQQAEEIRNSDLSIAELSRIYGLGKSGICDIKRGNRYKTVGVANSSVFAWRPAA